MRIACTQLSGHCANTLPDVELDQLHPAFALGREGRQSCAGTVVVDLDTQEIWPAAEPHLAFVRAAAPTALCD